MLRRISILASILIICALCLAVEPKEIVENGGWCWFQDERAIFEDSDTLLLGSVKTPSGDIDASSWNLKTGETKTHTLSKDFNCDDHAAPAFLKLSNGEVLAVWSSHGNAKNKENNGTLFYAKKRAGDSVNSWGATKTLKHGGCYNNLYQLESENGKIYNFVRSVGWNPNYHTSVDMGETFPYGGRFLFWKASKDDPKATGLDGNRPYVKYASDGKDKIHFISTESHPRAYDNSLYHGYLKQGKMFDSQGGEVGALSKSSKSSLKPSDFTKIFDGDAQNVAWGVDLNIDKRGNPVCIFSVQKNAGHLRKLHSHLGADLRYYYAIFDGKKWHVNQMAFAGSSIYTNPKFYSEPDYSALAAIVPHSPDTVYISTNSNPQTGEPLVSASDGMRHFEIFKGKTSDMGKTWTWTAVTKDSKFDNIRPIVPISPDSKTVVLWLRGSYTTYCDYNTSVVGIVD